MRQPPSIFNDVIGPVMVGPSSSHTAASVRIGRFIRALAGDDPRTITFFFSRKGALADCHELQGSDMGLAAGILGMDTDDLRIGESMRLAGEAGIRISFCITDDPIEHPNTYSFIVDNGEKTHTGEIISTGGGMIEVRRLDGFPVSMTGGYHEVILYCGNMGESDCAVLLRRLEGTGSFDEVHLSRSTAGDTLINVKSASKISQAFFADIPVKDCIFFPPILPVLSRKEYCGLFNTAEEILAISRREGKALWEIAVEYETRRSGMSANEVFHRMEQLVITMEYTLDRTEHHPKDLSDRILGPQAYLLDSGEVRLRDSLLTAVLKHITLLMEAKSSLEVIVAAPTSGACAALPGTLIGAARYLQLERRQVVQAMLAAGIIGILLVEHSTISGEVGGCQAECGSASGMAAAGLAELLGGSTEQALKAASMALQNVFGLVCDPVAERVEVPCLGRNLMAGTNALSMATLALAGFQAVIPLDETIRAMSQVGSCISPSLRCTCQAGLSVTPTSLAITAEMKHRASNR